jgi:LuxR family maltose regulon positive regulatory protein
MDYEQQALTHLGEEDWLLRSHVAWNLAAAHWLRGELGEAERALADVVAERVAAGEDYLAMRVCCDHGQVQRTQGHLGAALRTYRQGLQIAGEVAQQPPFADMAHVGLAEVLYERGEVAAAHEHATQGVALCRHLTYTQPLATGYACWPGSGGRTAMKRARWRRSAKPNGSS